MKYTFVFERESKSCHSVETQPENSNDLSEKEIRPSSLVKSGKPNISYQGSSPYEPEKML